MFQCGHLLASRDVLPEMGLSEMDGSINHSGNRNCSRSGDTELQICNERENGSRGRTAAIFDGTSRVLKALKTVFGAFLHRDEKMSPNGDFWILSRQARALGSHDPNQLEVI